jgi:hypothetical protein
VSIVAAPNGAIVCSVRPVGSSWKAGVTVASGKAFLNDARCRVLHDFARVAGARERFQPLLLRGRD